MDAETKTALWRAPGVSGKATIMGEGVKEALMLPQPLATVWASILSYGTSYGKESNSTHEFVKVILDLQDDETIVLRSVDLNTVIKAEAVAKGKQLPPEKEIES